MALLTDRAGAVSPETVALEPQDSAVLAYSRPRKAFLLVTLLSSWVLANVDRVAMSISIVPMTKELNLSAEAAGLVLSAFFMSYALMQLVAGWLADRFGSRKVLVFCVGCWSVFTTLTGFAGSLTSLFVVRILFGIGEGGFAPASSVTIAEAFPREARARAKSLVIGASFLGAAIGSGAIAALIASHGWRYAYHVFGLVGVVMAIVLWLAIKESPRRGRSQRERGMLRTLFRSALLRRTMLVFFFGNIVQVGLSSWMPSFLMKTRNIDILHVGAASAVPFLVAFGALNVVGWLLDRYGEGREQLFIIVGSAMTVVFLGAMAFTDSLPILLVFWTLSLVGYTVNYGTVFAIPLKHLPDRSVGTAAGIINFGGQVGSALGPLAIGMLVGAAHGAPTFAFAFLMIVGIGPLVVGLTWGRSPGRQ